MVTARFPTPGQIEATITAAAALGINEAMERIEAKASRVAPYDPKDDGPHLRDSGEVKLAKILPGGAVKGGVRFLVRSSKDNYPYGPVQHEGFYFNRHGRRVPAEGYFRYQHPFAKREFLGHTLRSNRFAAKRTVAKHIRAAIALGNKVRWL